MKVLVMGELGLTILSALRFDCSWSLTMANIVAPFLPWWTVLIAISLFFADCSTLMEFMTSGE
jgi:hypothetical protein